MQTAASLRKHSQPLRMEVHWMSGHCHLLVIQAYATVWCGRSQAYFSSCASFAYAHVVRIPAACPGRKAFGIPIYSLEVTRIKIHSLAYFLWKVSKDWNLDGNGDAHTSNFSQTLAAVTLPLSPPHQKSAAPNTPSLFQVSPPWWT